MKEALMNKDEFAFEFWNFHITPFWRVRKTFDQKSNATPEFDHVTKWGVQIRHTNIEITTTCALECEFDLKLWITHSFVTIINSNEHIQYKNFETNRARKVEYAFGRITKATYTFDKDAN